MNNALFAIAWVALIAAVFYLVIVRPQRKQNLARRALVESLQVGDEVVTLGGFIGKISGIDHEQHLLELELAPGTRVNVIRDAIARKVLHTDDAGAETSSNTDPTGTGPSSND